MRTIKTLVGEKLKKARLESHRSRQFLVEQTGVSLNQIYRLETGRSFDIETIETLFNALGYSLSINTEKI